MYTLLVRLAPRLFKPSLAHPKRSIRLMALQRLNLAQTDSQNTYLKWLTQETDLELIRQALPLFPASQQARLLQLLEQTNPANPASFYQPLVQHLCDQLKSIEEPEHLQAIRNTDLLLKLIQQAEHLSVRQQVMQQLEADEETWLDLALSNSSAPIRHLAIQRLDSEAALETLIKEGKGDKKTQRIAREKLSQFKAARQEQEQARLEQQALVASLQQHLRSQEQGLFAARLEHLERQWQRWSHHPAAPQTHQAFQEAVQACRQKAEQIQQAVREQKALEAQQAAARQQQADCLEQLHALEAALAAHPLEAAQPTQERLQALLQDWHAATLEHPAQPNQQQAFKQGTQQLQLSLDAIERLQQLQPELQALLAEPNWTAEQHQLAQKQLKNLAWPAHLPQPETLQQLHKQLKQPLPTAAEAPTPAIDETSLVQKLEHIEQLLSQGKSRKAEQSLQQLQQLLDKTPQVSAQHLAHFRRLSAQATEYKDWQGFVAAPKRETLCEQMEALADDDSMELQAKADRIQALQQEWRDLGSAAVNKDLWKRFKQAADLAYEPCKAWFAEQARLREYNQQQKQTICQELEELAEQEGLQKLDEAALDLLLSRTHDEWRRFNPVNRAEGKRLAERFQQALQPIKDHLYQLRQSHAEQKRALIEQALALLEEPDLQAATARSKEIQAQWRDLGRAPGSLEHQLWKSFRAACDELFEKRNQEFAQQKQAQQAHQKQAQKQHKEALLNLLQAWQQLPEDQAPACEASARRLTVQLETLAELETPAADQELKMQLQVERLKAGLTGEANSDPKQALQQLFEHWRQQVNSRQGPYAARFYKALEAATQKEFTTQKGN